MLANTRLADPTRDEVTCPFNPAHVLVASRLGNHLIKCAKNYPDIDKVKCLYNSDHIVPKHELEHHMETCPNRKVMDTYAFKVGNSECPVKNAVPIHVEVPDCGEDWDSAPAASPLEVINENIAQKPVMRVLAVNGRTKSERKQFKLQEQQRLRRLEEEAKKTSTEAKKTHTEVKKAPKKVQPKPASDDTPLRLPKTSKLGESSRKENEIGSLANQFASQSLDEDSGFDKDTYYDNKYMGGYGLPTSSTSKSCDYGYGDECPETYDGRGYDVDYYGGYCGGYGGEGGDYGNYEDSEEEVFKSRGPAPRWLLKGKGGGDNKKKDRGVQSRLVHLKEQHLEKQRALKVNVDTVTQAENPILSPADSVSSTGSLNEPFKCDLDENGFFSLPITSRGRGKRRF
ncbi:hypothetical protein LSTR_LSTR009478 [Laodelphax striatellus]|uniref:CHHC U11-48K-type domain-containing protein n=1 Tax=Laodelphax striatellus TaxID=195883 RepID=A0A482WFE2_LAOST|nr:hypothetical protein LSTR_LSTR009478 [Laodelphax striatellus]